MKVAGLILLEIWFLGTLAHPFSYTSYFSKADDEMCDEALKAGKKDYFQVNDFINSRGSNRALVTQTIGSITALRNSLGYKCSYENQMSNNFANAALRKILTRRIMTSEWLTANVLSLNTN